MSKSAKKWPIEVVDTSREDAEYWEQVLLSHGLSMARGSHKGIVYAGTAAEAQAMRPQNGQD